MEIIIDIPIEKWVILEYLIKIKQVSQNNSNFISMLLDDYVSKNTENLNQDNSWVKLKSKIDLSKNEYLEELLTKFK